MNLDDFLRQASEVGETVSGGAFTTTMASMLERLAQSLLVDPSLAPLVVVAAAVGAGAFSLDVAPARKELVFSLAMEEPELPAGQDWPAAFQASSAHHLLVAAAVWRKLASRVTLSFPKQGRQLVLTPSSLKFESVKGEGDPGLVRLVVAGKVPAKAAVELLLLRHCGLCPIRLLMAGTPLQARLDRAYGQNCVWSATVPEHLRPPGPARLEGDLALLVASTKLVKPHWVAVVGGISYPFLLPEAGAVQGIVWSNKLRTDLSMTGLVLDTHWSRIRLELLRLAAMSGFTLQSQGCTRCLSGLGLPSSAVGACPALSDRLRGRVLSRGSAEYLAEVAGFNTAYQHTSAQVVAAIDAADLVETVRYARQHRLRIAVQATGHGVFRPIEEEILISTRRFQILEIDPRIRTARIGAGVTWGQVFDAAAPHGLVPVAGSSRGVGVVGYLLGGGLGPLARSHGFSSDYLKEVAVVTGEGRLLLANAQENPELFWALRGGKVGLGVVTEVSLRLVELPGLYAGTLDFDAREDFESILRGWLAWTDTVPTSVSSSALLIKNQGYRGLCLRVVFPGSPAESQELVAPLAALSRCTNRMDRQKPDYLGYLHRDPSEPAPFWVSGMLLSHADDGFFTALLQELERHPTLRSAELRHLGGATHHDVPEGSAVGGRLAKLTLGLAWSDEVSLFDTQHPASEERLRQALDRWICPQANINFAARVRDRQHFASAWPAEIRCSLEKIRELHDPDGVFVCHGM